MAAFLLIPLSIAAGMIAGSIAARRAIRGEMDQLRSMLRERQNGGRTEESRPAVQLVAAPSPAPPAETVAAAPVAQAPVRSAEAVAPAPAEEEGISPEILMVLSAAVAAFLGKRARIRKATLMPAMGTSAWAQQGRVFVQASHNLAVRHR